MNQICDKKRMSTSLQYCNVTGNSRVLLLIMVMAFAFIKHRRIYESLDFDFNNNIDFISVFLYFNSMGREKERYIFPRSTHWEDLIFSSSHFTDCQFKTTFR